MVFLSGHIAKRDAGPLVGQFGRNLSVEEGRAAARNVAIDMIATLQLAAEGDLNRVTRIVKLLSLVNSTDNFTDHHLITNGASDLLVEVFGEKGRHARSAFGVAQIPLGACLEMELIAEIA
jgi:enamine deaminase RidA (YjgF/YER057c/UK114 family)